MKVTVLVFHPHLAQSRVNAFFIKQLQEKSLPNVAIYDEYQLYPQGQIEVSQEQQLLEQSDRIVLQFPFYWYSSPALLKKWEDVVLEHGWAYGTNGDKLHGKELQLVVSAGAPAENYQPDGAFHVTMAELLSPFKATSNLIGTKFMPPFVTKGVMQHLDDVQLAKRAQEYIETIMK